MTEADSQAILDHLKAKAYYAPGGATLVVTLNAVAAALRAHPQPSPLAGYDAETEGRSFFQGLLNPDATVNKPEMALSFLRLWANSYLLKGNYWDVPQTMGSVLNQVILILEVALRHQQPSPLTELVDKWRTEAAEGLEKWPRGAILPSKKLRQCADELEAALRAWRPPQEEEPEIAIRKVLTAFEDLSIAEVRVFGGFIEYAGRTGREQTTLREALAELSNIYDTRSAGRGAPPPDPQGSQAVKARAIGGGSRPTFEDDSIRSWPCGCFEDQGGYHLCSPHARAGAFPPKEQK